jgi:hypothetical protein
VGSENARYLGLLVDYGGVLTKTELERRLGVSLR